MGGSVDSADKWPAHGAGVATLTHMRDGFHGDLTELSQQLADMCDASASTVRHAIQAVLEADLVLAEPVLSGDPYSTNNAHDAQSTPMRCRRYRPVPGPAYDRRLDWGCVTTTPPPTKD
jgi:hypothetical protein